MKEYKVIVHIDELHKWKLLLANVKNLLNGIENHKVVIEVLANSEAVRYYDKTQELNAEIHTIESLSQRGVKFVACNNALIANHIQRDTLISCVNVVPAGVVELVVKQSEGYAYIKP